MKVMMLSFLGYTNLELCSVGYLLKNLLYSSKQNPEERMLSSCVRYSAKKSAFEQHVHLSTVG